MLQVRAQGSFETFYPTFFLFWGWNRERAGARVRNRSFVVVTQFRICSEEAGFVVLVRSG